MEIREDSFIKIDNKYIRDNEYIIDKKEIVLLILIINIERNRIDESSRINYWKYRNQR